MPYSTSYAEERSTLRECGETRTAVLLKCIGIWTHNMYELRPSSCIQMREMNICIKRHFFLRYNTATHFANPAADYKVHDFVHKKRAPKSPYIRALSKKMIIKHERLTLLQKIGQGIIAALSECILVMNLNCR